MSTYQQVIVIGYVGKDPEVRPFGDSVVAKFTVATTWIRKSASDETQEETEWHRVTVFDRQAKLVGENVRKGDKVFVEGRIRTNKWTDKNGVDRSVQEIIANRVVFFHRQGDGQQKAPPTQRQEKSEPIPVDDGTEDLPF